MMLTCDGEIVLGLVATNKTSDMTAPHITTRSHRHRSETQHSCDFDDI